MKASVLVLLSVFGCTIASGCGETPTSPDLALTQVSIDGSKYLLAEEPEDAVGVIEARESATDGEPIVIVGRIGGAANPWIEGRAAFTMIDASKLVVADGEDNDEGELCMDDCCAEERAGCTTLVKILGADGKLVAADARKLLGVTDSDMVVVRGKVSKDESGNFVVLSDGVHVRR